MFEFEVTVEDVLNVLEDDLGRDVTEEQAEAMLDQLDDGAIEKAALYGDDMDTQTRYALEEIKRQILEIEAAAAPAPTV